MGKYLLVVAVLILTAILAGIFPYARNNNINEQPLVAVLDTFYSAEFDSTMVGICHLGDSSFFIRTLDHVVLIDPCDKIRSRDIAAIRKLDLLLITQTQSNHYETTRNIYQETNSTIITNHQVCIEFEDQIPSDKLREIQPEQELTVSSITVTAIGSNRDANEPLMLLISMDGINIFYGSDLSHDEESSEILPDLSRYANVVNMAIVSAHGVSTEAISKYRLDIIKTLKPRMVVTMQGSEDEQNVLKNLVEKEMPSVSVFIPEKLWVYEIVVA